MAYKKDINIISGKINSPGSMSGIISHGRPIGGTVGKELEIVYYTGSETDTAKTTIDNKNKIIYVDVKKLPNSLRIDDRQQVFSETSSGEKYGIIHTFDGSAPVNLVLSNYKFGKLSDREYCLLKDGEPYGDTIIIPEAAAITDYVDELPEVDEKNNIKFARLDGDELYAAEYHNDTTPSTDILADTSIKGGSPYTVPNAQLCINTNYVTITDIVNGFNYTAFPNNKPFKIGKAKGLGSISFNVNTSKPYKVYIRDFITSKTAEKGVGAKVLVNGVEYSLDPTKDGTGLPKRVAISLPADVTTVTLESVEQDASVGSDNRRCFFFEGISIDGEEIHVAEWHKLARTSYVDAEIETVDNKITAVEEKLTTVEETVADNTNKLEGLTGRVFTIETEMGTVQIFDADYLPTAGKDYLNKILRVDNKLYQCINQGDTGAFAKHYSFENVVGTSEVTGDNYEHFANEVTDNFKDNFTAVDADHIWASTKVYRDAGYCKLGNSSTDGNLHLYRRDTAALPITYIGAVIKPWSATKASGLVISAKDAVNEVISDPILALPGEEEITVSLPGLNIGSESCEIDLASKGYNYGVDEAGSDLYTDHRIHIKELIVHYGVISYAWVEVSGGAKVEIVDELPEVGEENTIYLIETDDSAKSGINFEEVDVLPEVGNPKVIYLMDPQSSGSGGSTSVVAGHLVKVTYSELKTLRDNGKLAPGTFYRITDYECTTVQENTQSAGHVFDIIVLALDTDKLSEEASAIQHEGDAYFANNKLETWKLHYCLDNDTNRFAWADTINGKGIIYRMIDEFNNDCPYDFKNIQFKRKINLTNGRPIYDKTNGTEMWCYTFTATSYNIDADMWSSLKDGSLESPAFHMSDENTTTFNGNKLEKYILLYSSDEDYTKCGKESLSNNVFLGYYEEVGTSSEERPYYYAYCCCYNKLGYNCYNNTFGTDCNNNTFGSNCFRNIFGRSCVHNTFGNDCSDNTFGDICINNIFGNSCFNNIFGVGCSFNIVRNNYCSNKFGNGCCSNTFGNDCSYNTFGNSCYFNIFGNSCNNIIFGTRASSNTPADYYQYNIIDNGGSYFCLNSTATASDSNYLQNIHIHQGIQGTWSNYKTITVSRNLSHTTDVYPAGSADMFI